MNILKKYLTIMLLLGLTCPATACNSSSSSEDEVPPHLKPENPEEPVRDYYPKTDGATRLVTYNVGVFTKYVSDGSYQMIADMMTEGKADLVGISELDSCTVRTGRVFQLKKFAELMGKEWSYEYSRAMAYQGGAYGDGIASREKPVRAFAAPLPKGDGAEPRVMVVVEFEKYVFATTHLDHVSSLAQAGQVDEINKVIEREFGGSKKPVFLGGDFNARPDSPTISKLKTVRATSPTLRRRRTNVSITSCCGTATARSAKWSAPRSCSTSTKATSRGPRIIFPCWSMSNSNAETNS